MDLERYVEDISAPLVLAVDNFHTQHSAQVLVREYQQKIKHARQWQPQLQPRWLFLFTAENAPANQPNVLNLKPLTENDLTEWIQKISPDRSAVPPQNFVQQLYEHTNGNPA